MKALRNKVAQAAGKIKEGIERSVLADEDGRPSTGTMQSVQAQEQDVFVRLPLESARNLRCLSKGDVGEIIARHLQEKEDLLSEIIALRDLCAKHAPHENIKQIVSDSKIKKRIELTKLTNSVLIISAKDEIASLKKQAETGGSTNKTVAAYEWKLEEAECEITMLKEELEDMKEENEGLLEEVKQARSKSNEMASSSKKSKVIKGEEVEQKALVDNNDKEINLKLKGLKKELRSKDENLKLVHAKLAKVNSDLHEELNICKILQKENRKLKEVKHNTLSLSNAEAPVSLSIKVVDNPNQAATKNHEDHALRLESLLEKLQQEKRTIAESNDNMELQMESLTKDYRKVQERLTKQQKVCKSQRAQIDEMQLKLVHAEDKVRNSVKAAKENNAKLAETQKMASSTASELKEYTEKEAKINAETHKLLLQVKEERKKQETLEKKLSNSTKEHMKNLSKLDNKLKSSEASRKEAELKLKEMKDICTERDMVAREADTLRGALDSLQLKMENARKDHEMEINQLREKGQNEMQDTVDLIRQLELRSSHAERDAEIAIQDLQDFKEMESSSLKNFVERLPAMVLSNDRSTWTSTLRSAIETLEDKARNLAMQESNQSIEKTNARIQELEAALELKDGEINKDADLKEQQHSSMQRSLSKLELLVQERDSLITEYTNEIAQLSNKVNEIDLKEKMHGSPETLASDLEEWKARFQTVSDELKSFKQKARSLMEAKDKELLAMKAMSLLEKDESLNKVEQVNNTPVGIPSENEKFEREMKEKDALIISLQNALEDSERTHELRDKSETVLKNEIHDLQRVKKRDKVDLTYVKNVLLKGFESGELPTNSSLTTVLSRLLEFSPEEFDRIPKQTSIFKFPTNFPIKKS